MQHVTRSANQRGVFCAAECIHAKTWVVRALVHRTLLCRTRRVYELLAGDTTVFRSNWEVDSTSVAMSVSYPRGTVLRWSWLQAAKRGELQTRAFGPRIKMAVLLLCFHAFVVLSGVRKIYGENGDTLGCSSLGNMMDCSRMGLVELPESFPSWVTRM